MIKTVTADQEALDSLREAERLLAGDGSGSLGGKSVAWLCGGQWHNVAARRAEAALALVREAIAEIDEKSP